MDAKQLEREAEARRVELEKKARLEIIEAEERTRQRDHEHNMDSYYWPVHHENSKLFQQLIECGKAVKTFEGLTNFLLRD
ncbi:hypothetical protein CHS0354_034098 [Potamilus streckersoni]|uniref:Uncharacterized protein n=1 Tax=Potamilus streckersoni TaxID=2493646 RepID=A0AAE0TD19_9BIVA|nr:hypothetical protein CHS0354_034098 [Potamilus streckersoni]